MASAFVATRKELGVRRTGIMASVPETPKARLMYYLDCVATVLETGELSDYTDYSNYWSLSEEETDQMLKLAVLFSPDELIGKLFFLNDELCGDFTNEFYELENVHHILAVTDSVMVGGRQRTVAKIMTLKRTWLRNNYLEPIDFYRSRLSRIARGLPGHEKSRTCVIL